jgi:hypothetical protein
MESIKVPSKCSEPNEKLQALKLKVDLSEQACVRGSFLLALNLYSVKGAQVLIMGMAM